MSTYWDVYCVPCKTSLGLHGNNQEAPANAIAADAPRLALVPGIYVDVYETYNFFGEGRKAISTNWFAEHAGPNHEVVAKDEYGRISGRCGAYTDCKKCGAHGSCDLKPLHEGDHEPFRNVSKT